MLDAAVFTWSTIIYYRRPSAALFRPTFRKVKVKTLNYYCTTQGRWVQQFEHSFSTFKSSYPKKCTIIILRIFSHEFCFKSYEMPKRQKRHTP